MMRNPDDAATGSLDAEYEEYIEFQCPLCKNPVTDDDASCPGCGAVFVSSGEETASDALDKGELEADYELDDDLNIDGLDAEALEAELDAMEADLDGDLKADQDEGVLMDGPEGDLFDLDLKYEEDLEQEEEIEKAFGNTLKVSADDHLALEGMSKPSMIERLFQRGGMGMFIAGGIATVLVVLWDPIHGTSISLGVMQWRFLVLALAMFMVGFAIEMLQAYSLTHDDDRILREIMEG